MSCLLSLFAHTLLPSLLQADRDLFDSDDEGCCPELPNKAAAALNRGLLGASAMFIVKGKRRKVGPPTFFS